MQLMILSGGAANGIVKAVEAEFCRATGATLGGSFGAVGAMQDKLLAGTPADLLILTKGMIAELEKAGHVLPGTARDIGAVPTSVAARKGDPLPLCGTPALLKDALLAADELFVPDTRQSTAGVHLAGVLESLGIFDAMAPRLREFPNGATAMKALGEASSRRPIGATQRTEILASPGVTLVRDLPEGCGLATVYTAAVAAKAASPDLATRLIASLTAPETAVARTRAGFEVIST